MKASGVGEQEAGGGEGIKWLQSRISIILNHFTQY